MNDEMPLSYKGVEFDAKLEQLMRYVRGSDADKLPKEEFRALMESMLARMMDLSDGQAMIDMENDRLRAENAEMLAELLVTDDRDRTHSEECWKWRGHHACAIARVKRLEATLDACMPGEETP